MFQIMSRFHTPSHRHDISLLSSESGSDYWRICISDGRIGYGSSYVGSNSRKRCHDVIAGIGGLSRSCCRSRTDGRCDLGGCDRSCNPKQRGTEIRVAA